MHLVRLHLRNFKRYRDQEVLFRDGITGILGNNGAGKTTIVDAVLFALYGVEHTGLEKKHIVRASAGPRERAEVRLEFSVRGEDYTIVRTLGPKIQHTAQLNHGQKLLAKGVTESDEKIRGILQMGPQDFMHTIFSAQKDLAALLDATPGSRKAWFRKVLGIDALKDTGGETLRREIVDADRQATLLEGRLQGADPEALLRQRGETDQAIVTLEDRVRARKEEQSALDARRTTLEVDLQTQQNSKEQALLTHKGIQAAEADAERVRRELGRLQEETAAIESCSPEFQTLSVREAEFPAIRERYDASTRKAQLFQELSLKEKMEVAQQEKNQRDLVRLRKEQELLEQDEALLKNLAPAVARRREVQSQLAVLSEKEEQYHTLKAEITRKEGELAGEGKRGADLRGRIERMKAARERLASLASQWPAAAGETADPDIVLASLEARRKDIRDTVADLRADHEQAASRKAEAREQLAGITARGPEGPCPTCRQSLGERFGDLVQDLQEEIRKCSDTMASTAAAQETAERELTTLDAVMGEARGLRDSCAPLGEALAEWEAIRERSLRLLGEKESLEQQTAVLGYTPSMKQSLEQEKAALESGWKEHLTAAERVKALPAVRQGLLDQGREREKIQKELEGITLTRDQLAFDPVEHQRLEVDLRRRERERPRFQTLKAEMERIPKLEEKAAALRAEGGTVQENLKALQAKLADLVFSPQELDRVRAALQENQGELVRVARELQAARSELTHRKEERARIAEERARLEKDRADLDRLHEEVALLDLTRDHLNGFSDHLLGVVRDQVQGETGRILSEITDGRYDTVLIDDGFDLLVHDLGGDYPVARFSGGEQDDVAIALRIALSRYIAGMHELHDSTFLIFDEIFGSQDEERRGNIFRALRTLEPHFPQIFLISHVAEVQGEFGNTLMVEAVSATESKIRDLEAAEA
jgi:exonuclease SbcC